MEIWGIILEHPIVSAAILIWVTIWLYTYLICGVCKSRARMDGKTVIITGCTSGIGKATAFDLAMRRAKVIMACRNMEKANLVRDSIIKATKNSNVVVRLLDVSRLSSVRKFAEEINRTEKRLDVLIHNAGITVGGRHVTEEGLQLVWATNYFGAFLLTHLLIDLLKRTGNSRIITVSSSLHKLGSVDPKNPNPIEQTDQAKLYHMSKFAEVLFSNELARRLEGSGVTSNSLHPGAILTQIWDKCPTLLIVIVHLLSPFFKSEEQGAQTTIYLAVSEDVEGVTGKYFQDCKESNPAKNTLDVGLAKKFWEASEVVVQLKPTDPHI